ncbi:hypothetical protein [Streptomyces sp. NBC_01497]|nr:hypothetical protein [Streptomyces sp. NBC_01497]
MIAVWQNNPSADDRDQDARDYENAEQRRQAEDHRRPGLGH